MQQSSDVLNLAQALGVLRRRAPLILLCVVVVAGASYGFSKHQPKKYTATASLAFSSNPLSRQISGLSASNTSPLVERASDIELVRLGDMAEKTAKLLGHGLTGQGISANLSIAGQGESGVVSVSATATSPKLAAEIATTYADQFVKEQQSANQQYFKSALALVDKQLAALPRGQKFSATGATLQSRTQTLQLAEGLGYGEVQVAQEALVPTSPSSPRTLRNTVLGAVLGLLLGLGLAFVLERLNRDRRITEPRDLEAIYHLPLLGSVPACAALSRPTRHNADKRTVLPPAVAETFNLIRAHLRFFNVDRDLRTVLVTSAAPGDGKTTIARHLAEAAARMGSRVLLLEADLRHPALAQEFGIHAEQGLPNVLIGTISMKDAIQQVILEPSGQDTQRRTLDVLTAGAASPPNPGKLIESHAMTILLEQVKSAYDLVVIDTPPLTAVSDAFPLLCKVDGVVIVSWVGRSRRDAAELLHQTFNSSRPSLLGIIANGVKSSGLGPHAYVDGKIGGGKASLGAASTNGALSSDAPVPTAKV